MGPQAGADDPPWPDDAVEVGYVIDAWGIKGGLKVTPHSSDPQALFSSRRWFLRFPQGKPRIQLLRITSAREQGDVVVATAQGIDDRNAAEALKGAGVFVSRQSFPTAGDDEFYWVDLIGLAVVNREGEALGSVTGLLDTGAHSVLRVQPAQADVAERLIPFVGAYVDRVSLAERRIDVDWGPTSAEAMLRFDVVTLFPELFTPHLNLGVTRRAFEPGGPVDLRFWPLRDFADDAYRRVDDRPYGGGPGMVMLVEPLTKALARVRADRAEGDAPAPLIHFTPTGRRLDQALLTQLANGCGAVLLCGRYEGVDQRFVDAQVTLEISLGDFVLSGGELPALALLDGVARLQPGVLNDAESHQRDSFSDGLLEGPHYSRPEVFGGVAVPEVLMSGHHARIERWRRDQALALTARRRPDLIEAARAAGRLSAADLKTLAALGL